MNKSLIFLIISTSILVLSAIVICIAPIINHVNIKINTSSTSSANWNPSDWKNINCKFFADQEKRDDIGLDRLQKMKKYKNLCRRQKAMHGLEFAAFIIDAILGFICADLTLLHYLNVGKDFEKKTGLIGLISGIIGFILTLVYVCYSGYIFNNDIAFGILDYNGITTPFDLQKLYSNGALYKWDGSSYITVYSNDKEEDSQYLKYKDLGKKQYNYDSNYYETYQKAVPDSAELDPYNTFLKCNIIQGFSYLGFTSATDFNTKYADFQTNGRIPRDESSTANPVPSEVIFCDYLYYTPSTSIENKYIYDRWLTSLVLAVFIIACNLALAFFGFLLFKSNEGSEVPASDETPIVYKK